jgi:hypothetical protein
VRGGQESLPHFLLRRGGSPPIEPLVEIQIELILAELEIDQPRRGEQIDELARGERSHMGSIALAFDALGPLVPSGIGVAGEIQRQHRAAGADQRHLAPDEGARILDVMEHVARDGGIEDLPFDLEDRALLEARAATEPRASLAGAPHHLRREVHAQQLAAGLEERLGHQSRSTAGVEDARSGRQIGECHETSQRGRVAGRLGALELLRLIVECSSKLFIVGDHGCSSIASSVLRARPRDVRPRRAPRRLRCRHPGAPACR